MGRTGSLCGACLLLASTVVACLPYTVATTAQPVPEGKSAPVLVSYAIPNGIDIYRDSSTRSTAPVYGLDMESRLGVTQRADVGVRIPSGTGIIVNYKHRLSPSFDANAAALAIMVGGGFVNLGSHAFLETTFIASGRQAMFTPYGGLRLTVGAAIARRGARHADRGRVLRRAHRPGGSGRERRAGRVSRPVGASLAGERRDLRAGTGAARRRADQVGD